MRSFVIFIFLSVTSASGRVRCVSETSRFGRSLSSECGSVSVWLLICFMVIIMGDSVSSVGSVCCCGSGMGGLLWSCSTGMSIGLICADVLRRIGIYIGR